MIGGVSVPCGVFTCLNEKVEKKEPVSIMTIYLSRISNTGTTSCAVICDALKTQYKKAA